MEPREAASYLNEVLKSASTTTLMQSGSSCINVNDPVLCAQRIVADPKGTWRLEYARLTKEIFAGYGKAGLDTFYTFVYAAARSLTQQTPEWIKQYLLPTYNDIQRIVLLSTGVKAAAPTATATLIPRVVTSRVLPGNTSTIPMPGQQQSIPENAEPVDRPVGQEYGKDIDMWGSVIEKEYGGYRYRALPVDMAQVMNAFFAVLVNTGTFDAFGKTWQKMESGFTNSNGSPGLAVYDAIVANGQAVVLAKPDMASPLVGITGISYIEEASQLTTQNNSVVVIAEPKNGWQTFTGAAASGDGKPNYLLYGGVAIAALAGVGAIYYYMNKK